MTTTTLHGSLQRSRFAHHALTALAGFVPAAVREAFGISPLAAMPSAADSASREAQSVRALAHSYAKTDPGFAADLYAAAARHEGLHTN